MSEKKNHFIVYKTESEKVQEIIKNTVRMLSNRVYFNDKDEKINLMDYDEAMKKLDDQGNNTFIVGARNGTKYAIKIIFQKISNTGKQSPLSDFFADYSSHSKIVVATDFNNKISQYAAKNGAQIFTEASLLMDIVEHELQPKFEVMSPSEIEQFKREYNVTDYSIKKILKTDPIIKYYGLKKGAVVKIIRPSPISGKQVDHRIVT